jgi:hypothetical protein
MSKTSADERPSLISTASNTPEGARLMQAIQAQAAQWGLLARKVKRPSEPSDAEEKRVQDCPAGQVGGEALAAADLVRVLGLCV